MTDRIFYRGDKKVFVEAQIEAAKASKPGKRVTIGKYIDEALKEKIKRGNK